MTRKLYEENVYLKQTTCKIIETFVQEDKKLLVLDRTLFFPEGGGQSWDLGTIDTSNVLSVYIRNDIIYHQVDSFPEGIEVVCTLDWERRFDHMQQHCGEHILSGVFMSEYALGNKGFHLGEEYVSVDMDVPELSKGQIDHVEALANMAVWENQPVTTETVMTMTEAQRYPLRKTPDIEEDLRVVKIGDVDIVACCGTHPSYTGEVGMIKILKWQKYKSMTRVFFICGNRTLKDYQHKHQVISQLNVKFSADVNTLWDKIETDSRKKQAMLEELNSLRKKVSETQVKELVELAGNKIIISLFEEESIELLQLIGNSINALNGGFIYLLGSIKDGTVILAHDGQPELDCGKRMKEMLQSIQARGGGSKTKAQAVFKDSLILREFFAIAEEALTSET